MTIHDIPTPALVADLPAMERNIRRMADYYAPTPVRLRPHFKAHKTPAVAKRQIAAGSCIGITCATVGEAEIVFREGITDDILVANEILGPGKARRAAELARDCRGLKIAIDSEAGLRDLANAVVAAKTEIGVLVDVNVGLRRCGVMSVEGAVTLARQVVATKGLKLHGVMGYEGHAVGVPERPEREDRARKAMDQLLASAEALRGAGLTCEIVSGGGTGTYDITGARPGITEVQPGSYVLLDTAYAKLNQGFESALRVLITVVSRPKPELCVGDCGLKGASVDQGMPALLDVPGGSVLSLHDEHTIIGLPAESKIAPGDRLWLQPSHIDPTINLHDAMFAVIGEQVTEIWPVTARGYPEHRALVK